MSSDGDKRRPTREERQEVRRQARDAVNVAKRKAKDAARAAAEEARESSIEAALQARTGRAAEPGPTYDPLGVLWADEATPAPALRGGGRRGRAGGLSRAEIVQAGLRVAAADGPDAISMRRIATELGVGTMSLYHHIPTKDDLLDLMQDQVMGELVVPAEELAGDWQEALAQISRRTRAVYERHRWMVSAGWERPRFGPRGFAHVEQSLAIMAGVPPELALQMLGAADDYVIGFVTRRTAEQTALERMGMDEAGYEEALRPHIERLLSDHAETYPHLSRYIGEAWDSDADARFEIGLRWLLAGMAMALPSGH
jgi:AcrR family transcriptional regulator